MQSQLSLFVFFCFIAVSFADSCCGPSQMQGYVTGHSYEQQFETSEYFYFDLDNQRLRFDVVIIQESGDYVQETTLINQVHILNLIVLKTMKGVEYITNYADGTCYYTNTTAPVPPVCTPPGGDAYDFTLGVTLPCTTYFYKFGTSYVDFTVEKESCIPISGLFFSTRQSQDYEYAYFDVIPEILDPLVFVPPTGCTLIPRLENGLLVVLEMRNIIEKSRIIITEGKEKFIENARMLAITTSTFVVYIRNYIHSLNKNDETINFLSDIMQSCIYTFEQNVVKAIQSRKLALQNPFSISSFYASYRFSETIVTSLENILWISQLLESTDTEAKHLLTTEQLKERLHMFTEAKKLASIIKELLDVVESSKRSSEDKVEMYLSLIFQLSTCVNAFIRLISKLPNSNIMIDQLTSSIEAIILFARHMAYGTEESYSGLQQARNEFILTIKDIIISLHKSLNSELTPLKSTKVNERNKRAGVRVIAKSSTNSDNNSASRSLDISDGATRKLDDHLNVIKQAESLYITLQIIESMRNLTWFKKHYENECTSKKLLLIKRIHENILNSDLQSCRIRKINENIKNKQLNYTRNTIIGNLTPQESDIGGILLSVANTDVSDINLMKNISITTTRVKSQVVDRFKKKRLSVHSFTETICLFHASTEGLVRSFQPEIPKRVDLNITIDNGIQCCNILERMLMLASMVKNENATEPPPKLEQLLLQSVFQSLVDIACTDFEPDQDTLRAMRKDGVYCIIKYTIDNIKELQLALETISIQICSIVRQFQRSKDVTISGILGIIAPITLYVQKLKDFISCAKTYNFATTEIGVASISITNTEEQISFWDEIQDENNIKRPKIIEKISLNNLIGLVTSPKTNERLQYIFIRNYPSFISEKKLLQKLSERYFIPNTINNTLKNEIRHSVLQFISKWVAADIKYLDRTIIEDILSFLKNSNLPIHKPTEQLLKQALHYQQLIVKASDTIIQWADTDNFMKLDDYSIAEQLTLIDFNIYKKISRRELLLCAWSNPKLRYRAVNVRRLIERQNHLAFWITTMIVSGRTVKDRIEIWEKWIRISLHLQKLNNFNSLMGIIAASNMAVSQRLHHTKNGLKKELLRKFEDLGKLMAPHKSWAAFREELKCCTAPAIPYLGVFLTDLTFIHDGNKDIIDGLINWKKVIMIYRVLETVRKFQKIPYNIEIENPIYTWVLQLPGLDDETNYQLSLLREPKKIELKVLLQQENSSIL